MAYSEKVLDHYENPRNVGSLDKKSGEVGTGLVGAPECGDVMKLQIQVEGDRIVAGAPQRGARVLLERRQRVGPPRAVPRRAAAHQRALRLRLAGRHAGAG